MSCPFPYLHLTTRSLSDVLLLAGLRHIALPGEPIPGRVPGRAAAVEFRGQLPQNHPISTVSALPALVYSPACVPCGRGTRFRAPQIPTRRLLPATLRCKYAGWCSPPCVG